MLLTRIAPFIRSATMLDAIIMLYLLTHMAWQAGVFHGYLNA